MRFGQALVESAFVRFCAVGRVLSLVGAYRRKLPHKSIQNCFANVLVVNSRGGNYTSRGGGGNKQLDTKCS